MSANELGLCFGLAAIDFAAVEFENAWWRSR
jgi:hypothetical protein